jgi:hypothetical protein
MAVDNSREQFQRCWPWLEPSLNIFGPTHTIHHVWDRVRLGHAFLWPGERSAILVEPILHPIGLRSLNVWLQGGDLPELKSMHPALEQWAREHHCDQLIAWGRDGWLRALDGWQSCGSRRRKVLEP